MTLNDLEWLFHDKMRFWPALLEAERLNVRNSTTSAILRCSVHFAIYMYLYTYAQLTRCFSAVAELLVNLQLARTQRRDTIRLIASRHDDDDELAVARLM